MLLVCLAASEVAVSAVLIRENKGTQSQIYYIRKTLINVETRYPHLEKLALALVVASRKLIAIFSMSPHKSGDNLALEGHSTQTRIIG